MSTATERLDLAQTNQMLTAFSAEERIQWAVDRFGAETVLLSSMQKTASVLMHMFAKLGLENEILFGDTGFHFHETLQLRDEYMRRYKVNIVTMYPELTPEQQEQKYGRKLHMFADGQPECCRLRKEEPFLSYMRKFTQPGAIVGARRVDGKRRANLQPVAVDPRIGGYSVHPIYDWNDEQVADYLEKSGAPVHPLHAQSYPSIGCECCTTPVALGEPARAGRWRHLRSEEGEGPQYCGINFTDGSGI